MTSAIELRNVKPQRLLVKKTTCLHTGIGPAFGRALSSVGKCMRESGGDMRSMPIAVYLAWRENDCDMAAGCQVGGDITLDNGVEWLEVPGGEHAFATHTGPYEGLKDTHAAIREWAVARGKTLSGPCWEGFATDPGNEPDQAKWQTDIYYPVS